LAVLRSLAIYTCAPPVLFRDSHLVKVCDLGIAGLNLPLSVLDFVSLLQLTRGHSLVDGPERLFHLRRETTTVFTNDTRLAASKAQGFTLDLLPRCNCFLLPTAAIQRRVEDL
jgi:hypothetical protein